MALVLTRGIFREEALRRHAVRDFRPRPPAMVRRRAIVMLWLLTALLAIATGVVALAVLTGPVPVDAAGGGR